jgi:hypothetical protein
MAAEKSKKKGIVLTLEQRVEALEMLDGGKPAYKIAQTSVLAKRKFKIYAKGSW